MWCCHHALKGIKRGRRDDKGGERARERERERDGKRRSLNQPNTLPSRPSTRLFCLNRFSFLTPSLLIILFFHRFAPFSQHQNHHIPYFTKLTPLGIPEIDGTCGLSEHCAPRRKTSFTCHDLVLIRIPITISLSLSLELCSG
jgi:hypothetical protein